MNTFFCFEHGILSSAWRYRVVLENAAIGRSNDGTIAAGKKKAEISILEVSKSRRSQ